MRTRIGLCLLVILSICALVGCGSSSSANNQTTSTPTPALESITVTPALTSLAVGATQQFQAMGSYSDGSSKNISSNVTWSSSASGIATISTSGLLTGVKGGAVTITAALNSISSKDQLTVVPVLLSIAVTPVGPALLIGGTQQFTATGIYNDGSTQNLTSTATWNSSSIAGASMTGSTATAVAVGPVTITATASGMIGATSLNVVSNVYSSLLGNYAFTLESSDSRGGAFYAGSINADGNGNITGVEDSNTAGGVQQNIALSGTYVMYPDGRGNIVFSPNKCHPTGITLRVILTSAGATGFLTEFDGVATANGTLLQQTPAAFNAAGIDGTYVFMAAGLDTRVNATGLVDGLGEAGMFTADGVSAISSGIEDVNDNGVVSGQMAMTPSTYSVNGNARGTFQMITSLGTSNYALYVVDATKFIFIQTDTVEAASGVAELQTVQTYSNLNNSFSYLIQPPVVVEAGNPSPYEDHVQMGKLIFQTAGTLSGTQDEARITGTYSVSESGINGRGQMQLTGFDDRIYFFYMVSPAKMFVLQAFTYSTTQRISPATGEADAQTGAPFTVAALTGSYALATHNLAANATDLAWISLNGSGGGTAISDLAQNGSVSSMVVETPVVTVPVTTGDGDLQLANQDGTLDLFDLVSPQQAWVVGLNPPLAGSLQQQ
jgi:hypothetical protein